MAPNPHRRHVGRPTDYQERYVEEVENLCKLGLTVSELAVFWGVDEKSITTWEQRHPAFAEAVRRGRTAPDVAVAVSLFKRATGYEHQSVKIFLVDEIVTETAGTGDDAVTITTRVKKEMFVPYTERYPPDTAACIFWLKNRRPDLWRDKIDHDITSGGNALPAAPLIIAFVEPSQQPGDGARLVEGQAREEPAEPAQG